jgi:DNA-binding MarR family transcriptional regulator
MFFIHEKLERRSMPILDMKKSQKDTDIGGMPSAENIPLFRDRLGVQLSFVGSNFITQYNKSLEKLDLRPSWVFALGLIAEHPGMSQSELGRGMDFNRASAMALAKNLENAGLVSRTQAEGRKRNELKLTTLGQRQLEQACEIEETFSDKVTADISEEERAELSRLLKIVSRAIETMKP